ncbi:hypothetical protein FOL47_002071 [Perkinsus chesapeaki]|uniref:Uncharacterized protein n=1 Tax=Perkinsus chesapeaki TaxID=330153 RepID=A0A7J6MG05_PERCH|nr:hypothetical protein FOL47_002071 [Perkinsus chesapeaki]
MPSSTLISLYTTVAEERLQAGNVIEAMEMLLKTTQAVIERGGAKQQEKVKMLMLGRNVVSLLNEDPTETRLTAAVECLESLVAAAPEEDFKGLAPLFALTMSNLAELRKGQGRLEKAIEYLKSAVATIEGNADPGCMRLQVISYMNLSELSSTVGTIEDAVRYAEAAVKASEQLSECNDSCVIQAIAFNNYAVQLTVVGSDIESAKESCNKAIEKIRTCPDGGELERVFKKSLDMIETKEGANSVGEAKQYGLKGNSRSLSGIPSPNEEDKCMLEQLDVLESAPSTARHVALAAPVRAHVSVTLEDNEISRSESSVRVFTDDAIGKGEEILHSVSNMKNAEVPYIDTVYESPSPISLQTVSSNKPRTVSPRINTGPKESPSRPQQCINAEDRPRPHQSDSSSVGGESNFFLERMMNAKLDNSLEFGPPTWKVGYDYGSETFVVDDCHGRQWTVRLPEGVSLM